MNSSLPTTVHSMVVFLWRKFGKTVRVTLFEQIGKSRAFRWAKVKRDFTASGISEILACLHVVFCRCLIVTLQTPVLVVYCKTISLVFASSLGSASCTFLTGHKTPQLLPIPALHETGLQDYQEVSTTMVALQACQLDFPTQQGPETSSSQCQEHPTSLFDYQTQSNCHPCSNQYRKCHCWLSHFQTWL
jgi:hypothetical protein